MNIENYSDYELDQLISSIHYNDLNPARQELRAKAYSLLTKIKAEYAKEKRAAIMRNIYVCFSKVEKYHKISFVCDIDDVAERLYQLLQEEEELKLSLMDRGFSIMEVLNSIENQNERRSIEINY